VFFGFGEDLGGKHPIDAEKLKFDRITAGIGRRIDEFQSAAKLAAVVGRSFGDE
jgi:hypothetical protein